MLDRITRRNSEGHHKKPEAGSSLNRCLIMKIVLIIILIGSTGLLLAFYKCSIPVFSSCNGSAKVLDPLIVQRNFQVNSAYSLNYTTFTTSDTGQNKTESKTNKFVYIGVKNVSEGGDIELIGYIKKISEETLSNVPPST